MEALASLGHFLVTLIVGLFTLTVLVYVHELGHYLFAKRFGMKVNAFAIFMGGVRKTDLYKWLDKPQIPVRFVWIAFFLSFAVATVGALVQNNAVYLAGLLCAGVVVPGWAMTRLAALYHVPLTSVLRTWLTCLAVGAVVLMLGTKLRGLDPNMVVGVAVGASIIALILVYYLPVQMREAESDEQGFGHIEVKCGEDGAMDKLPVRYRPLWHRVGKDGTEYSLLMLPLGGFAQIAGMHPKPDGSEVKIEYGFYSKPPLQRLAVLFAGPLFSILFGVLLLWGLYAAGGKDVVDKSPVIGGVTPNGPAAQAGLKEGDRILAVDGSKVSDFYDFVVLVRDNVQKGATGTYEPVPTAITYLRDGKEQTVVVTPAVDQEPRPLLDAELEPTTQEAIVAVIKVGPKTKKEYYGFGEALGQAVNEPIQMVAGLASIVTKPKTAKDQVSGPTVMAQATSVAVERGPYYIFYLAGMLSISLGVMNLLPIVPLDGGQMLVAVVEMARKGRRLSLRVQNILANSGIALLLVLMLAVSAVDLGRRAKANTEAQPVDSNQVPAEPQ